MSPGRIVTRIKMQIAQKEEVEGRQISYDEISNKTGIAPSTISRWATNMATRYDADTLKSFCQFFNCQVGDLLVYLSNGQEN